MKRWSVLAFTLLALLGLPAAACAADALRPDGRVHRAGSAGPSPWIPHVATANAIGVDWNALELADELPGPVGDPLPAVQTRTTLGVAAAAPAARRHVDALILPD